MLTTSFDLLVPLVRTGKSSETGTTLFFIYQELGKSCVY